MRASLYWFLFQSITRPRACRHYAEQKQGAVHVEKYIDKMREDSDIIFISITCLSQSRPIDYHHHPRALTAPRRQAQVRR